MASDKRNSVLSKDITEGLHKAQIMYMKRLEKENLERVMRLKRVRKRNIFTGLSIVASVYGLYVLSKAIMRKRSASMYGMNYEDEVK